MQADVVQGTMGAITAAVAPVVMISANAILIGAIASKHQAMSDRIRMLAAEWRITSPALARRESIRAQVQMFERRIRWIARAHLLLYLSTAFFLTMVLVIALTPVIKTWSTISVPLLVCGTLITLLAIVLELFDLFKARVTLEMESGDVLERSH